MKTPVTLMRTKMENTTYNVNISKDRNTPIWVVQSNSSNGMVKLNKYSTTNNSTV